VNRIFEDAALQGVALDPAFRNGRAVEIQQREEKSKSK
jgi:hypothetical protein